MQAGGPEASGKELPERLKPLLEQAHPSLTEPQKNNLVDLLHEFQDCFTTPEGPLGCTGLVKHQIDTGTLKPIRQPPRRLPQTMQEKYDQEVEKMLQQGVVEPSHSPWSSPVVLVTKSDGTI